jgi:hypothetical protein
VLNRPQGSGGPMLAMAEMRVFSAGVDVSRNAAVSSLDTINSGLWHRNNLVDGYTSRGRIGSGADELLLLARTESGAAELREEVSLLTVKRDALFAKSPGHRRNLLRWPNPKWSTPGQFTTGAALS